MLTPAPTLMHLGNQLVASDDAQTLSDTRDEITSQSVPINLLLVNSSCAAVSIKDENKETNPI